MTNRWRSRGGLARVWRLGALVLFLLGVGCKTRNLPPDVPQVPSGLAVGLTDSVYTFVVAASDPDDDSASLQVSWGDSSLTTWSELSRGGETSSVRKSWAKLGRFPVKVRARDVHGAVSDWSVEHEMWILDLDSLPLRPVVVKGPGSAEVDFITDGFSCVLNGPPGESLSVDFDWGAGDIEIQAARGVSGERLELRHSFFVVGVCSVRVRAQDCRSERYSDWSAPHPVQVTRTLGDGWEREYGVEAAHYDLAYTVEGELVLCGEDYDNEASHIIRADKYGNLLWIRDDHNGPVLLSIRPNAGRGLVAAGWYGEEMFWVYDVGASRTDADGNAIWSRRYTDDGEHQAHCVRPTVDGGAIIGSYDLALKVDSAGDTVWFNHDLPARLVEVLADGHCCCYGYRDHQWVESEVDQDGRIVTERPLLARTSEEYMTLRRAVDGSVFLVRVFWGSTCSTHVTKLAADGRQLWDRCMTGLGEVYGWDVAPTDDGGCYVVGESWSVGDYGTYLARLDQAGRSVWELATDLPCWGEYGYSLLPALDGGRIVMPVAGDPVNLRKYDAQGRWTPDSTGACRYSRRTGQDLMQARRPVLMPKNLLGRGEAPMRHK